MRAMHWKYINFRTIVTITISVIVFLLYTNRSLLSHDVVINGIISLMAYLIHNILSVLTIVTVIFLTIKLVKPVSRFEVFNYKKITINKNKLFQLILMSVYTTPFSWYHIHKYSESSGFPVLSNFLREMYFLHIFIYSISIVLVFVSYFVIKKKYDETMVLKKLKFISELIIILNKKEPFKKTVDVEIKENTNNYENKIRLFFSTINKERIIFYIAEETDFLVSEKKGKTPPIYFF